MAMPTLQELYRPILEIASETAGWVSNELLWDSLRKVLPDLTDADLEEKVGRKNLFRQRIRHSLPPLKDADLLISKSQKKAEGPHLITEKGRQFLATLSSDNVVVDDAELKKLRPIDPPRRTGEPPLPAVDDEPERQFEPRFRQIQEELEDELAAELLDSIKEITPDQFERLVVDLLEKMGYGKGETVGRKGDGGIDGVIDQDPLGLEKIYIQAKRWSNQVGEPEVRNFSGSLDAKGASKGVLIATSQFSMSAIQTAEGISKSSKFIRLINGDELARLMIDHGVGIITKSTYQLKMLDENYFADV